MSLLFFTIFVEVIKKFQPVVDIEEQARLDKLKEYQLKNISRQVPAWIVQPPAVSSCSLHTITNS